MVNRTRRGAVLVAALATALALGLAGSAFAADDGARGEACAFGHATGTGTTTLPGTGAPVNAYTFDVCRTGPAPTDVTGEFAATTPLGPGGGIPAPRGTVTCAEFSGNSATFTYVLDERSNPSLSKGTVILIHSEDDGTADKQGFTGPLPAAAFTGCASSTPQAVAAQATALPASGISVTAPSP